MSRPLAVTLAAALAALPECPLAAGVDGQRFAPATGAAGGFMVERTGLAEHLAPSAGLFLNYADDPIVETDSGGGTVLSRPLQRALGADLLLSVGLLGRAELGVDLPVALVYEGDGLAAGATSLSPATGLGDLRVVPKALLWRGGGATALALGAALPVTFPTGDGTALRGADGVTVEPRLLAGIRGARLGVDLSAGFRFRGDPPSGLVGGDEVTLGAAVTWALSARRDVLDLHAEAVGGVLTSGSGPGAVETPLSALAGVVWKPRGDLALHAGLGAGLTRGLGEPDFRAVLGVRWSPRRADPPFRDRDVDGIADVHDRCPDQAEDEDGFEDADGCPDPDDDRDGVADDVDECPRDPEEKGGDGDGCPDASVVVVEQGRLGVSGKVQFETASATIKRGSFPLLDAVARVIREHPALRIRVDGHTDDVGEAAYNQRLSEARADSVRRALVERGVEPARLRSRGLGETQPIAPNRTPAGRAVNRRVEFITVEQE
jgi:OmpA-OmpF porin, OOP family